MKAQRYQLAALLIVALRSTLGWGGEAGPAS